MRAAITCIAASAAGEARWPFHGGGEFLLEAVLSILCYLKLR
jgi:hypothetical protein